MVQDRKIKSYAVRTSSLNKAQSQALAKYQHDYCMDFQHEYVTFPNIFGDEQSVVCDIGFGMGRGLVEQIERYPNMHYFAIEVYPPGVASTIALAAKKGIDNLRIVQHDAVEVLESMVAERTLDKIQLLYPDPWPKKRHHKRRILDTTFLDIVAQKLKFKAIFQIITDWDHYAEAIQSTFAADTRFDAVDTHADKDMSWPDPLATNYAKKAQKSGHTIHNLIYQINC